MKRTLFYFFIILLQFNFYSAFAQCGLNTNNWSMVFNDDFDTYNTTSEMTTNWRFEYPWSKNGINECYEQSNVVVDKPNGLLYLNITRNPGYICNWVDQDGVPGTKTVDYKAGMIFFNRLVDPACFPESLGFNYGIFEIKCKMPKGVGLAPAFWVYNGGTEIDVFEAGNSDDPRTFSSTTHQWDIPKVECSVYSVKQDGYNLADEFHTYSVAWTPTKVTYFFDGRETWSHNNIVTYGCPATIIAGVTVHPWTTLSSTSMVIDYIRVYKPNANNWSLPYKSTAAWKFRDIDDNPIISSQIATANGSLGAYLNNNNEVFYRGTDNKLHRYYWNGSAYTHELIPYTYTANDYIAGNVIVSQIDGSIYYQGANGRLQRFYKSGGIWQHTLIDQSTTLTRLVSNNQGAIVLGSNDKVFYRGYDNKLHLFYWNTGTNSWVHELPAYTYGSTAELINGEVIVGEGDQVFYRGNDARMQVMYKSGSIWYHGWIDHDWSTSANTVSSNYGSMALIKPSNRIFYRGTDNKLHSYKWSTIINDWVHEWIYTLGSQIPVGGKVQAVSDGNGGIQVYFRGTDNKLSVVYTTDNITWYRDWPSSWNWRDPATIINGDNFVVSDTKIFVKKSDNYIHYFSWETCENLNPVCQNIADPNIVYRKGANSSLSPASDIQDQVNTYPNPTTNNFKINWAGHLNNILYVEAFNFKGDLIFKTDIVNGSSVINLSDFPIGIYLLKIKDGEAMVYKKIVKE